MARCLLVPVKAFGEAKLRLAPVLSPDARAELVRRLTRNVLRARGTMAAYVACDDEAVATWAIAEGASVLWTAGLGLSGAVEAAVAHLARLGHDLVVVAHGDLPFVEDLEHFGDEDAVTFAPDRVKDGTNVAAVPARAGFHFSYGPGSFTRHCAEAARLGLPWHIVEDWRLATDVDHPADLDLLELDRAAASLALGHQPGEPTTNKDVQR